MSIVRIIGTRLYQWERGRQLQVIPLPNHTVSCVHFSNPGDPEALVVKPKEANGMLVVDIPNILLQNGKNIVVHTVDVSETYAETLVDFELHVRRRAKPSNYVYTEVEILNYETLEKRMKIIEENGVSDIQIAKAVEKYLDENPIDTGVDFETNHTLKLENGILSVNTTNDMEQDNTLPITSAGVFATVGNIEELLKTI